MVKEQVGQNKFGGRGGTDPLLEIGGNNGGEPVLASQEFESGISDSDSLFPGEYRGFRLRNRAGSKGCVLRLGSLTYRVRIAQ